MITIDQMIQREVCCCLSSLVSTLASGYCQFERVDHADRNAVEALQCLTAQAFELASSIVDWDEAATQAGWTWNSPDNRGLWHHPKHDACETSTEVCEDHDIEPYDREVFEHWAVSNWLAKKLIAQGEKVDTDFAAMNVWARTTTGQGIANDSCIEKIYADTVR